MARWDASNGMWVDCHFVLTRAGFLHWWKGTSTELAPMDGVNLSRSAFEQGEAPIFKIIETAPGYFSRGHRKMSFKAQDVDECGDWVIALRESIAAATH